LDRQFGTDVLVSTKKDSGWDRKMQRNSTGNLIRLNSDFRPHIRDLLLSVSFLLRASVKCVRNNTAAESLGVSVGSSMFSDGSAGMQTVVTITWRQ